jgi:hypothetical protein
MLSHPSHFSTKRSFFHSSNRGNHRRHRHSTCRKEKSNFRRLHRGCKDWKEEIAKRTSLWQKILELFGRKK